MTSWLVSRWVLAPGLFLASFGGPNGTSTMTECDCASVTRPFVSLIQWPAMACLKFV